MVVLHTAHLVALNYNFVYFLTNKMNLCIKHYSISLYLTFFFFYYTYLNEYSTLESYISINSPKGILGTPF